MIAGFHTVVLSFFRKLQLSVLSPKSNRSRLHKSNGLVFKGFLEPVVHMTLGANVDSVLDSAAFEIYLEYSTLVLDLDPLHTMSQGNEPQVRPIALSGIVPF